MKPILEIQGISKRFTLHHQSASYMSFRERLTHIFDNNVKEDFWALSDVSFQIQRGESIGIIGRNGAGKSTLLKILSRITPPTKGRVIARGRIASLLEVGTGFHYELTGYENIFMNGSILGMKKSEIKRKFDEIVDFSGTEKFLDTQLKHYSSGMQLRLAFAVAAHLEPEILIIDEVLAVGDAEFQRKCFDKMSDVTNQGRTILLVSHNMEAIQKLCVRGILLEKGQLALNSNDISKVTRTYLNYGYAQTESNMCEWLNHDQNTFKNSVHNINRVALTNERSEILEKLIAYSSSIRVFIEGELFDVNPNLNIGFSIYDQNNKKIFWSWVNDMSEGEQIFKRKGSFFIEAEIPSKFINQGKYRIEIVSVLHNQRHLITPGEGVVLDFEIMGGHDGVYLTPNLKWNVKN